MARTVEPGRIVVKSHNDPMIWGGVGFVHLLCFSHFTRQGKLPKLTRSNKAAPLSLFSYNNGHASPCVHRAQVLIKWKTTSANFYRRRLLEVPEREAEPGAFLPGGGVRVA